MPGLIWILFLPVPFTCPRPLAAFHHPWMNGFCNSICCILWIFVFLWSTYIGCGGKGVSQLLLVMPFIAITVLFLITQVRFWALLLHCKKQAWRDGTGGMTSRPDLLSFEEWFSLFPLKGGKKLFSLVHLKFPYCREVPILDKCHYNTECSENLNF